MEGYRYVSLVVESLHLRWHSSHRNLRQNAYEEDCHAVGGGVPDPGHEQ